MADETVQHDDYFTLLTGLGLLCVGLVLVLFAPLPILSVALCSAGAAVSALAATYLPARAQKVKALSIGLALVWLGICAMWAWGLTSRAAPFLLVLLAYLVAVIGRVRVATVLRGEEKGAAVQAAMDLEASRSELGKMLHAVGLPPDTELEGERTEGGTKWLHLRMPAGVVAKADGLGAKVASFLSKPDAPRAASSVKAEVPEHDGGLVVVEITDWTYFDPDRPVICPAARPGVLHMGWLRSGKIVNLEVEDESAGHMLAAGLTGSGKSETLRSWIAQWLQQICVGVGVKVWAADPSGGKSLRKYRRFYTRFATTPAAGVELLRQAAEEVENRYQLMAMDPEEPESWQGDWLAVAVDELPQLLDWEVEYEDANGRIQTHRPAADYVKAIVSRGRSARVTIGAAALSPRATLMKGESKSQFPHRFAHEMMQSEVNIGLDQGAITALNGRGPHKIKGAKGRAFCRLPGWSTFPEVQVFLSPPADLLESWGVPVITPERSRPAADLPTDRPAPPHVETPAYAHAQEQVTGQQVTPAQPHPSRLGKWGQHVLDALKQHPGGLSGRRVSEVVGCSVSVAQSTLKRLQHLELVTCAAENGVTYWLLVSSLVPEPAEDLDESAVSEVDDGAWGE